MNKQLLSYPWKITGCCVLAAGLILLVYYLSFDFVLRIPVFAVYSAFLETHWFSVVPTNIADELILAFLLTGLALILFSKEKNEQRRDQKLRFRAMTQAIIINTILLFVANMFVYGTGFIVILLVNLFTPAIIYLGLFYYLRRSYRKRS